MPALYSHTTRLSGTILTSSIYNADHQNHIDNAVPALLDDYSTNLSQMQLVADPGELGSESLPVNLGGEIERLRFGILEVKQAMTPSLTRWYQSPTGQLVTASAAPTVAGTVPVYTGTGVSWAAQNAPNPIINGNMDVWQRGAAFGVVANTSYTADRWRYNFSHDGVININRSTNVPTVAQAGVLFNYSLEVDVTVADASLAAAQVASLVTRIEGYNWRHFAQQQMTLSFWVSATKTGTHCVSFLNSGQDRSYVGTYTINAADTWEYKTVTVLPSPSAGTWNYTNGIGLEVGFCLGSGTNYHTAADTWQTGQFFATSAQVNTLDSASNFFRITGVRLERGAVATPASYADFQTELVRCQRYYNKSFEYTIAPAQNSGLDAGEHHFPQAVGASSFFFVANVTFPVRMRAAASTTFYNPAAANAQVRNSSTNTDCSGTSTSNSSDRGFCITATTPAGSATGQSLRVHWTSDAEL
jgi:hypothetical protein